MTPQDWIREAREVCEKGKMISHQLPGCMIPDGADPCDCFLHVYNHAGTMFRILPQALDALDSAIIGLAYTPCPDSCYAYDPCWACATLARISAILSPEGKGEG